MLLAAPLVCALTLPTKAPVPAKAWHRGVASLASIYVSGWFPALGAHAATPMLLPGQGAPGLPPGYSPAEMHTLLNAGMPDHLAPDLMIGYSPAELHATTSGGLIELALVAGLIAAYTLSNGLKQILVPPEPT